MQRNIVRERSFAFAARMVRLNRYLIDEKNEYVLSKQLLRSGTSIGANITEALDGFSRNDFLYKMSTALKECSETRYWIELLYQTDYLTVVQYQSLMADCRELQRLLTSIVKSTRHNARPGGSD
ncbi:MAG: four helix bundle protein [bacterium]